MAKLATAASRGFLLALALFGLGGHALLLAGSKVPTLLLPACLVVAGIVEFMRKGEPVPDLDEQPRWLTITAVVVVVVVVTGIAFGLTTTSRAWDGFVSWELRARVLTEQADLQQPFFADHEVFSHSRDYPLLQPLAVASINRLGLPGSFVLLGVFVAWLGILGTTLHRLFVARRLRTLVLIGAATTPMLVSPTSGGVDSGYGDLMLMFGITAGAAGLASQCRQMLFCGAVVAVLAKPEGMVYGLLPVVVGFCGRDGLRHAGMGLVGWALAAALLVPLQHELQAGNTESCTFWVWGVLALGGGSILLVDRFLAKREIRGRTRVLFVAVLGPALLLGLPLVAVWSGNTSGAFGVYLSDLERPLQRLSRLGSIVWGQLEAILHTRRFGLLFPLLLVAWWTAGRERHARSWTLSALLVLGLGCVLGAFLLSPEDNLKHHLRSSMTRLVLQQVGVAWLLLGLSLQHGMQVADTRSWLQNRDDDRAMT